MAQLEWGKVRVHEEGVDRGVVYTAPTVSAWAGLTEIVEEPIGGDVTSVYFDGVKTLDMVAAEDFSLGISAYTYPVVVENLEGGDGTFNFTYRTIKKPGRKIHLVYNATMFHDAKTRKTKTETPEPSIFSWTLYATPTKVTGAYPTAHLVVDTTVADPRSVAQLEAILYGDANNDPRFPPADEVVAIFANYATLVVVDHGDGTWTATGPDEAIRMLDPTTFEITWPSAVYVSADTYTISSL